jgi:uncharacterized protein (TIGR02466 family)
MDTSKYTEVIKKIIASKVKEDVHNYDINLTYFTNLFPSIVFLVQTVIRAYGYAEVDELTLKKYFETAKNEFLSVESTHKTMNVLHTIPAFYNLAEEILSNGKNFLNKMGWDAGLINRLEIGTMWTNVSRAGEFVMPHTHPGSILSGVFYVKKFEGSRITFFNDVYDMIPFEGTYNSLSNSGCHYDCEPGRLMLWKSNLLHGTSMQPDGEKIVISFNLSFKQ